MSRPKYSIIIPTKNEEENISSVLEKIPTTVRRYAEIIVVDSSDDSTPKVAEALGAVVIRTKKEGKGNAMKIAASKSKGKVLVFLDGDGSDPPEYIPSLLKKLKEYDLVLASRDPKITKELSTKFLFFIYRFAFVNLFLNKFHRYGFYSPDPLAGFRAIRKRDFDILNLKSKNFEVEAEMNIKALKLGFKIGVVPIPVILRKNGIFRSKLLLNPKEMFNIIKTMFRND